MFAGKKGFDGFSVVLIVIHIALEIDVEVPSLLVPEIVHVVHSAWLQVPKTSDIKRLCFLTLSSKIGNDEQDEHMTDYYD